MMTCNSQQLDDLLLGASLLATGGGCLYEKKKAFLRGVPLPISIIEASDLARNDLLCTVYAVGATHLQETDFVEALKIGIERVEAFSGGRLRALFAGELGAEHLAIKAAALCGANVLDADGAGGRAVPEIVQDQFALQGRETTPAFAVNARGTVRCFENLAPDALETAVRDIATETQGLVLVFDHVMRGGDAGILSCGTLTRSIRVGSCLRDKALGRMETLGLQILDEARVVEVDARAQADFFRATLSLQGRAAYTILIQNENLVLLKNGEPLVTCPHLIMLLDQDGRPVHNSQLEQLPDKTVTLLTARAARAWDSPRGYQLFSPRRFGWPYDVRYAKP